MADTSKAKKAVDVITAEATGSRAPRIPLEDAGVEFSIRPDALFDRQVMLWMASQQISEMEKAVAKLVGQDKFDEWLAAHTDDEGFCIIYGTDPETAPLGRLMGKIQKLTDPTG